MRRVFFPMCLVLWLAVSAAAWAQPTLGTVAEKLAMARGFYEDLEYDSAEAILKTLEPAALSEEQAVEVLKLRAFVAFVNGQPDQAREHFWKLLALRQGFDLEPSVSPRIREFFEKLRTEFRKSALVKCDVRAWQQGAEIRFELTLRSEEVRVARADLYYRARGMTSDFALLSLDLAMPGQFVGYLPGALAQGEGQIDYFVDLELAGGRQSARLGAPAKPLFVPIRDGLRTRELGAREDRPLAQRAQDGATESAAKPLPGWAVWAAAGVGAAVVTTGIVIWATQPESHSESKAAEVIVRLPEPP